MFHIYIYAANRVWDTDRISRLRRPLLKRRAITHLGRKHARLGSGWVVGKQEVIRFLPGCPSPGSVTMDDLRRTLRWRTLRVTTTAEIQYSVKNSGCGSI